MWSIETFPSGCKLTVPLYRATTANRTFMQRKTFKKKLGGSLCAMMSSSSFSNIFIFHCCKLHKHKIYYLSNRVPEQTQTQTPAIRSQPWDTKNRWMRELWPVWQKGLGDSEGEAEERRWQTAQTTHSVSIRQQRAFIIRPREQREHELTDATPDQLKHVSTLALIKSDHGINHEIWL